MGQCCNQVLHICNRAYLPRKRQFPHRPFVVTVASLQPNAGGTEQKARNLAMASPVLGRQMNSTKILKTTEVEQKHELCRRILAYLKRHPNAEDTLGGIAHWWLLEQRIQEDTALVQTALNCLVNRRQLVARRQADGRASYRLARSRPD
jgi:hypothetical protein